MRKRVNCLFALAVVFLCILCFMPCIEVQAKDKFEISADIGLDGIVRSGFYTPIYITVINHSGNFEGTVEATFMSNDRRRMYGKNVSLAAASGKTIQLMIPVDSSVKSIMVKLLNKKGKTVEELEVTCNCVMKIDQLNVGVLSDDFTALSYLDQVDLVSAPDVRMKLSEIKDEWLSDDWRAYDAFDVILISDYSTDSLSEEQLQALMEWNMQGGCLIVGTGSTASKSISGFEKYGMDCVVSSIRKVSTNYGSETAVESYQYKLNLANMEGMTSYTDPYAVQEAFENYYHQSYKEIVEEYLYGFWDYNYYLDYDNPEEMMENWDDIKESEFKSYVYNEIDNYGQYDWSQFVSLYGSSVNADIDTGSKQNQYGGYVTDSVAEVSLQQVENTWYASTNDGNGFDLVQSCSLNQGVFAIMAIDFTKEPFISYSGADMLFCLILDRIYGGQIYDLVTNYSSNSYSSYGSFTTANYYEEREMCEYMSSPATPPMILYISLIIAYFVALIIIFCVLKKRKKSFRVWTLYPVAAVGFSLIIFLLSFATKLIRPILYVGYITRLNPREAYTQPYVTVAMPKQRMYDFYIKDDTVFTSLEDRGYYYGSGNSSSVNLDEYDIGEIDNGDTVNLKINNSAAMQSEYFMGSVTPINREDDITYSCKSLSKIEVTNNSDKTVQCAFLCIGTDLYLFGDVKSGETITLKDAIGHYTNSYSYASTSVPSINESEFVNELTGNGGIHTLKGILFGTTSMKNKKEKVVNALLHYAWEEVVTGRDVDIVFGGVTDVPSNQVLQSDDKYREVSGELVIVPMVVQY